MDKNIPDVSPDAPVGPRLVVPSTNRSENTVQAASALRPHASAHGISLTSDILFAADSDALDSTATGNLDRLAAFLKKYHARTALIHGYTDNAGVDFGNQDLSLRRAESVESYLVAQGIGASRLASIGRGSTHPAASNESVVGRQQNRRVEVLISNDHQPAHRAAGTPHDQGFGDQHEEVRG